MFKIRAKLFLLRPLCFWWRHGCPNVFKPVSGEGLYFIIIIGTTTHQESWPPSEVSSTLLDSWLLLTNSLIPASLRPFPLHLSICTWSSHFS
jgi:hypothetical protein